jgi:type IV secretory pathway VirB10-like protein
MALALAGGEGALDMEISKAALGIVAAAGVVAGAGAAFVATRVEAPVTQAMGQAESVQPAPLEHAGPAVAQGQVAEPAQTPSPVDDAEIGRRVERAAQARAPRAPQPAEPSTPRPAADATPQFEEPRPAPIAEPASPAPNEPARPAEPVPPSLIELVVSADSVLGLQLDSTVSSDRARVEDEVVAHVVRDVRVGDRVAIPAGSRVQGTVTLVERGGKLKERARLGVRFTEIRLGDGSRVPIRTETIYREGDSQAAPSAAKIGGGAIGGAILGGILGGSKGAAIGGSIGAGAGTAAVLAGGRNQATLASGSPLTVRVEGPIVITVEP